MIIRSIKGIIYRIKALIEVLLHPLVILSKKIILPGFKGVPLYDVGYFFYRGMKKSSLAVRANAISFSFVLAAIPALLFFFTLIPYIPVAGLHDTILLYLKEALPTNAYLTIESTIYDIVTNHRVGLLSVGFATALYFSTTAIMGIMDAFNQSAHAIESRSAFTKIITSLILVFLLSLIFIVTASLQVFTEFAIRYLQTSGIIDKGFTLFLISLGSWILVFIMIFTAFSMMYYLAPAVRGSIPFFSAGAFTAAFLMVIIASIFNFSTNYFDTQNKVFGSIGTIIVIMVYINIMSFILLIGFELNASIYSAKRIQDRKL